jgi:hypothetical protein
MLSRELHIALKEGCVANVRALQGSAVSANPRFDRVLSGVCSIFYMAIVKKNEQG